MAVKTYQEFFAWQNITEGHQRGSTSNYVRYLHIAKGSLAEAETQIVLATRLKFLTGKAAGAWSLAPDEARA